MVISNHFLCNDLLHHPIETMAIRFQGFLVVHCWHSSFAQTKTLGDFLNFRCKLAVNFREGNLYVFQETSTWSNLSTCYVEQILFFLIVSWAPDWASKNSGSTAGGSLAFGFPEQGLIKTLFLGWGTLGEVGWLAMSGWLIIQGMSRTNSQPLRRDPVDISISGRPFRRSLRCFFFPCVYPSWL